MPVYEQYDAGSPGYKTEYDNFAPNVGVAWQPNVQSGWLRRLLGDPELATVRASYGVAYNSDGLGFYRDVYNANPGSAVIDDALGRQRAVPARAGRRDLAGAASRSSPPRASPGIPTAPVYPMAINFTNGVNLFDPAFQTPLARSFSVGLQRALEQADGRRGPLRRHAARRRHDDRELELRQRQCNCQDFTSNGFLDEFRLAQQNLQVAIAPGLRPTGPPACSFAYQGPGTGTSPLPIYLANFNGRRARRPATPRATPGRTGRTRRASTSSPPAIPNPGGAANALYGNATFRANLEAAGLPAQLLRAQPRCEQRQHHDQRRLHEVRLAADQPAPAPVGRVDARRQLHVRDALGVHARRSARARGGSYVDRRRAARAEVHGELRAAVRPGQAVRREREHVARRRGRRLVAEPHRAACRAGAS